MDSRWCLSHVKLLSTDLTPLSLLMLSRLFKEDLQLKMKVSFILLDTCFDLNWTSVHLHLHAQTPAPPLQCLASLMPKNPEEPSPTLRASGRPQLQRPAGTRWHQEGAAQMMRGCEITAQSTCLSNRVSTTTPLMTTRVSIQTTRHVPSTT